MKTSLHDSRQSEFSIFCWPEPDGNYLIKKTHSSSLAKSKYKVCALLLCMLIWLFGVGSLSANNSEPLPALMNFNSAVAVEVSAGGSEQFAFDLPAIECIADPGTVALTVTMDGDFGGGFLAGNETLSVSSNIGLAGTIVLDGTNGSGIFGNGCSDNVPDFFTLGLDANAFTCTDGVQDLILTITAGAQVTPCNDPLDPFNVIVSVIFNYESPEDPVAMTSDPGKLALNNDCEYTLSATDIESGSTDNCTDNSNLIKLISTDGVLSTDPSATAATTVTLSNGTDFNITGCTTTTDVYLHVIDECGFENISNALNVIVEDKTGPMVTQGPEDYTVECDGAGNTAALAAWLASNGDNPTTTAITPAANDNCTNVTWTYSPDPATLSDLCAATGAVTVSWTVEDDCGNDTAAGSATFIIEDTKGPDITKQPEDKVVECDGSGNTTELADWLADNGGATASDICHTGTLTWTYSPALATISDLCGETGEVTVTFTVTDDCGKSTDTNSATFTIKDSKGPNITTDPSDKTVECDGSGNTADLTAWLNSNGGAIASDDCDQGTLTWTYAPDPATLSNLCAETGAVTVVFTVEDACGQSTATNSVTFTIEDKTKPVVNSMNAPAPYVIPLGATDCQITVDATAFDNGSTDACGGTLTYQISKDGGATWDTSLSLSNPDDFNFDDLPSGASGCPATKGLKFRVIGECDDPLNPTYPSDVADVTLMIEDESLPTAVASNPLDGMNDPIPFYVDDNCQVEITAASLEAGGGDSSRDNCTVHENLTFQVFTPGFFGGGSWGSSTTISQGFGPNNFNFDNDNCPDVVNVLYRVVDQCENESAVITVPVTISDNTVPTFISTPDPITEPTTSTGCSQTVDIPFPFYEDNCTGILDIDWAITALAADGVTPDPSVVFGTLDSALLLAFLTGGPAIFWDSVQFPVGTTTVRITITDECGNSTDHDFDVTIEEPDPQNVVCPNDFTVGTSHNDDIDLTNTTIDGLIIPSDGTGTGDCQADVAWMNPTVTLSCNLISLETTFAVPDATLYPDLDCPAPVDMLPSTIVHNTGALPFGGFPDMATFPLGTTEVTITSYFFGGDEVICTFLVTVEDDETPTISCSNTAADPLVLETKADGATCPQVATTSLDGGPLTWPPGTWSNMSGVADSITVAGIKIPVPTDGSGTATGGFSDNCLASLTLKAEIVDDTNDPGTDPYTCPRVIQIQWTVTDDANCSSADPPLSASCIQYIQINDTDDPYPSADPHGIDTEFNHTCMDLMDIDDLGRTIAADSIAIHGAYEDDCTTDSANLDVQFDSQTFVDVAAGVMSSDCAWKLERTFIVTDECGNDITIKVIHEGRDQTPPALAINATKPSGLEDLDLCAVAADIEAYIPDVTAGLTLVQTDSLNIANAYEDNCGEDLVITKVAADFDMGLDKDCGWSYTITYEVKDECGNALDPDVFITHTGEDQTPPTGIAPDGMDMLDTCAMGSDIQSFNPDAASGLTLVQIDSTNIANAFSDNCGGDLKISVHTGVFSDTSDDCAWEYTITYNVLDKCDNAVPDGVQIVHTGGDKTPPFLASIEAPSGEEKVNACADATEIEAYDIYPDPTITTTIVANDIQNIKDSYVDACGGDLTVTNVAGGGALTGDDCSWSYTITYTIVDKCMNSTTLDITHVGNDKDGPTVDEIVTDSDNPLQLYTEDGDPSACSYTIDADALNVNSSDDCTTDPNDLTYYVSTDGNALVDSDGNLDPAAATSIDLTTVGSCDTDYILFLHVLDLCSNESVSNPIYVNLDDNTPPVVTCDFGETLNANLSCGLSNYNIPAPGITDACSNSTSITTISIDNADGISTAIVGENVGLTLGDNDICYTVEDECGNEAAPCCYTVVVVDSGNTPPQFSNCPANQTLFTSQEDILDTCAGEIGWNAPEASDNCPNFVVSFTVKYTDCQGDVTTYVPDANGSTPFTQGVHPVGLYEFTYTVTDGTSSDTCEFNIEIVDNENPSLTCGAASNSLLLDADGVTECPQDATVDFGANDNGDGTGTWAYGDLPTTFTVAGKSFDVPAIDDNCTDCLELTASVSDETTEDDDCDRILKVSFSLTDMSDATTVQTCNQVFTITEDTPPVITEATVPTVVQCDGSGNVNDLQAWLDNNGYATATDNCGLGADPWSNDYDVAVDTFNDCSGTGTITVKFTVVDECGNSSDYDGTFTIEDTTPPSISDVPDATIQCDDSIDPAINTSLGSASASDICSGTLTTSYSDSALAGGACPGTGSFIRTWSTTDGCGLTSTSTQEITVIDSEAPTAAASQIADYLENNAGTCEFTLETSDLLDSSNDNCSTSFAPEISLDAANWQDATSSLTLTGDFSNGCTQDQTVYYRVIDECGNPSAAVEVTVTLKDIEAPIASATQSEAFIANDPGTCDFTISVDDLTDASSDNCGPIVAAEISLDGNDPWVDAGSSLTLTGDFSAMCEQEQTIYYRSTDQCGNTSDAITVTVFLRDTEAPTPDVVAPFTEAVSQAPACDKVILATDLNANSTDNCSNGALEYYISDDGTLDPETITSESYTHVIGSCSETIALYLYVRDECGNGAVSSAVDVTFVDDLAPMVTCPANESFSTSSNCDLNNYNLKPATIVDCNVTNSLADYTNISITAPNGLVTTVALTSPFTDNIALDLGTTTICYDITDTCGNATNCCYTVDVVDDGTVTPPSINCPGDQTIFTSTITPACGSHIGWTSPSVSDNCPGSETTFIVEYTDCDGNLITYNQADANGDIANPWIFSGEHPVGTYKVIYTIEDAAGNSASCDFNINIVDDQNPTWNDALAIDLDLECASTNEADILDWLEDTEDDLLLSAEDNCGDSQLSISNNYVLDSASFECTGTPPSGTLVTFTLEDCSGNDIEVSALVTIVDTTAPVISIPADVTIECDTDYSATAAGAGLATATDTCDDDVVVTSNDVITAGSCDHSFTIARTWTATDDCGNDHILVQKITVVDTSAPDISCPGDITIECGDSIDPDTNVLLGSATASDTCDGAVVITYTDAFATNCGNARIITRTWTATDDCGNSSTCDQIITEEDTTDPSISIPADVTIECGADETSANTGIATGGDSCGTVSIGETDNVVDGCGNTKVITRTWTVTDQCGNAVSGDQTITVKDTTAPMITCPSDASNPLVAELDSNGSVTITVDAAGNIGGLTAAALATATDVCGDVSFAVQSIDYSCSDLFVIQEITITATDECNNSSTCTVYIDVQDNIAPAFTGTLPVAVQDIVTEQGCDETREYLVPASSDNCPGLPVPLCDAAAGLPADAFCTTITGAQVCVYTDNPIVNSNIDLDSSDGEFEIEFPIGQTNVTFVVFDRSCNSTEYEFEVNLRDVLVPFISLSVPCPDDVTLDNDPGECEADYTWQNPEFQDNCIVDLVEMYFDFNPGDTPVDSWMDAAPADGQNDANGQMQTYAFPVGITTVTYIYYDGSSPPNISTCEFDVEVLDTEPPSISCPDSLSPVYGTDDGVCTYTIDGSDFDATFMDNCEDDVTATLTHNHPGTPSNTTLDGASFAPGSYTITWTASDPDGNSMTCDISFEVADDEDPVLSCPAPITQSADAGSCGAIVEYSIGESDNCAATLALTAGLASGSEFPVGTTTNTFTLTDAAGNSVTCSFDVTITDDEDPTITCAADVNQGVDAGACGAVIDYTISSSDNCPGESISQTAGLASGSLFPVGVTTNSFLVTDASGNTATCSFDVTIVDDEAPVALCTDIDVFLDANGEATISPADVDGGSNDNCETLVLTIDNGFFDCNDLGVDANGNGIPGTATVNLTATDGVNLTSSCTATVTINDNLPPVLAGCQTDITIPALTGTCQNQFDWDHPTAIDNCDGAMIPNVPGTNNPATSFAVTTDDPSVLIQFESTGCEALFPIGTTTVTHTYTDSQGNVGSCSFTVTVTGSGGGLTPTASFTTATNNLSATFTDVSTNAASYSWDFGDNLGSSAVPSPTYTYASAGTYNVCLTIENGCGESDTFCQDVTVSDPIPVVDPDLTPTITVAPNILPPLVNGTGTLYYAVTVTEIAGGDTDGTAIKAYVPVDPRLTFTWNPTMTQSGFATVANVDWTYALVGGFHVFTLNNTTGIITAGDSYSLGFEAEYDPQNSSGVFNAAVFLTGGTGGETISNNNGDSANVSFTP